ncbi:preQ(1) synthase [Halovivax cerinus]|uniref:PreQ(1) synthase n=1 Tax=Halovivax cerinus TaxID=1487865 RepID=A0ABD5NM29_9EURY|nr:preQ(1) synthase [Halovivax cerinus]
MCAESLTDDRREDVLDGFEAPESDANQVYTFNSSELTALCPFDFGGPDYYEFTLRYIPDKMCVESKSLKQYLESFRDVEITGEEIGAEMYDAFDQLLDPKSIYLRLEQARRGGIEETVEYGDRSLSPN